MMAYHSIIPGSGEAACVPGSRTKGLAHHIITMRGLSGEAATPVGKK